jgi:hypothetical protein
MIRYECASLDADSKHLLGFSTVNLALAEQPHGKSGLIVP